MLSKKFLILTIIMLMGFAAIAPAQDMPLPVQSFLRFYTNVHWLQMPERVLKTLDTNDWAEGLGVLYQVELQRKNALPAGYERDFRMAYLKTLWEQMRDYLTEIGNSPDYRQNGYTGNMLVQSFVRGKDNSNFNRSQMARNLGISHYDDARSYFTSIDFDTIRDAMNYHYVNSTWRTKVGDEVIFIYFMPDGTYRSDSWRGNKNTFKEAGTYTVNGNRLTINYRGNQPSDTIQYKKINRNVFSITINGRKLEFHRPK